MAKPNKKLKAAQAARQAQIEKEFDENALEKLTSRIDQSLSDNQQKRKKPPTGDNPTQDRKRPRNGVDRPSKHDKKSSASEKDILLAEIKALGGDEKDLELVEGVDSDEEEEDGDQRDAQPSKTKDYIVDKSLKDELAALSKSLGLADYQPSEASEEEVDEAGVSDDDHEEEGDEEEDEDESIDDDEAEARPVNGKPSKESKKGEPQVKAQQQQPLPKKAGDLVGLSSPSLAALLTTNTAKSRRSSPELTGMPPRCQSCVTHPANKPVLTPTP